MQVSAEIRWFWPESSVPTPIGDWFIQSLRGQNEGGPDPVPESRVDTYLKCSAELGLKKRGGKGGVEVKGLVGTSDLKLLTPPLEGEVQIWSKWGTDAFQIDGYTTVDTAKTRWLRKFDTEQVVPTEVPLHGPSAVAFEAWPKQGCNVEYTKVAVGNSRWETFSFESFGSLAQVESSLRRTVEFFAPLCPGLPADAVLDSYPSWLARIS
jgi:hypothetical protein